MPNVSISPKVKEHIPDFKIGCITYHDIVIDDAPQMIKGRLQLYQESLQLDLDVKQINDFPGIHEWRQVFKQAGTDPSRYRHSAEALYRRLKKKDTIPLIHSAADINNFFSLQYEIPVGIYDMDKLAGDVTIDIGTGEDQYKALNGRDMNMQDKLLSRDDTGSFGSPITDSARTAVTKETANALQLFYLRPSMNRDEAAQLLEAAGKMFTQVHGGTRETRVIE
ncbi:B3/B4 domain-containing protein [Bacillus marinisedimentorum]|uniref:B3/B4 domain-containing protein n=1 Tax=Bacillus marinisedimentorum TaxID=1821260 RepID=UPI000872C02F|nr:phenylalanine--tRNA ligase beta subunit-related protein [Bacillus marinisedimentorum]